MASVLLVHDEYGTSRGGISTVNRQVALFLVHLGLKVYCTVLTATDKDREDAEREHVILLFPQCDKEDTQEPSPLWLYDHQSRYPDLPSDISFVIGHVLVTSRAAVRIKEQRFPLAKLFLFTHVLPELVEHFKGEGKALGIEEKMNMIIEDAEKADALFSVGPAIFDYYQNQYRRLQGPSKPHLLFVPKPSDIFIETKLRYVETETKVVLSIGRVRGVEKLKGFDLAAGAMSDVIKLLPKALWQVRGICKNDFQTSKVILESNIQSGTFHFTPLEYGTQDQICSDMKQAHLVLIPSRSEPFGLVGLEAIAAGVPVLVSDRSGLAEFMLNIAPKFDHSIFKLKGNDVEDSKNLAKKIVAMLQNSRREFDLAKQLKNKLLGSRYWEESQKKLAQACGKDKFKADDRPEAQMKEIPAQIQHHAEGEAQEGGGDQASSSNTGEQENAVRSAVSMLYKNTLSTLKPLPWDDRFTLDLDQIFTSLILVPEEHSNSNHGGPRWPNPGDSIDPWFHSRIPEFHVPPPLPRSWVPYHKMLESLDGVFDHESKGDTDGRFNVLVVGDAGSGKSTLLSKTALDWSCEKGRLAEITKIVLLVRLREVQPEESIAMIVWDQCVTQTEDISVVSIETCLRENEPKLVFLLDGYDELVPGASEPKETIPKLLAKRLYPRSTVIVTSRPYSGVERYMKVNCAVKVVGFSSCNVEKYVTAYFNTVGETSLAVSLIKALQANVVARSLIQTPMFLMLICVLWEEDPSRVFPGTMSGLYQELLTCVIRKYCVREGLAMLNDEVPSGVSTALRLLGKLALESLLRGESLVDLGKTSATQDTDILLKLGIVSKEVSASRLHPREQLNFPHKTMQEFLAGKYVGDTINTSSGDLHELFPLNTVSAILKQSNLVQSICSCGGKATMEMVSKLSKLHEAESKKEIDCWPPDMYACMDEAQQQVSHQSHGSNESLKQLCLMSLYEGQDASHFPLVSTLLSCLDLTINFPSREAAALKYYLRYAPTVPEGRSLKLTVQEASKGDVIQYLSGLVENQLPDLKLYLIIGREGGSTSSCHIGNVLGKLIPFLRKVPKVRLLNLRDTGLTPESLQALEDILPELVMLEKLDLSDNRDIGDMGNAGLEPFAAIQQPVASLKVLKFSHNQIGDVCLRSLVSVLHHLSCLEELDLSHNNIGEEDKESFASIQHPVVRLKMLDLSHNKIGDVCIKSLSSVLHHLSCVEELNLSYNYIGDRLLKPFAAIQHPIVKLRKLNLCCNTIGSICLRSLLDVVHHLPCLEELGLYHNQIGIEGIESYLKMLNLSRDDISDEDMKPFAAIQQPFAQLKMLDLSRNVIGDRCMRSLVAVLYHLSCLKILNLSHNHIGDTELSSLAAELHHVPNLQDFRLFYNPITAVGIRSFVQTIPMMPALTKLCLYPQETAHLDNTDVSSIITMLTRLPVLEILGLENISMQVAGFWDMVRAVERSWNANQTSWLYTESLVPQEVYPWNSNSDDGDHDDYDDYEDWNITDISYSLDLCKEWPGWGDDDEIW